MFKLEKYYGTLDTPELLRREIRLGKAQKLLTKRIRTLRRELRRRQGNPQGHVGKPMRVAGD